MLKRKTAALSGGKKYYSFIQLKKSWIHWLIDWYWLFLNVFELSLIKLTTLCYCWTFQADTLNLCSNILCQIFPVNYESCTMKIHVGPLFYKKKMVHLISIFILSRLKISLQVMLQNLSWVVVTWVKLGPCQGHSNDSVYFLPRFFSAGELWFPKIKSLR